MHCRLVRNAPTPNHPQKALKSDRRNFARSGPCHGAAPLRPSPHSVTDAAERSRFPAKEHLHTALSCTLRGTEPVRPPAVSPCLPPPARAEPHSGGPSRRRSRHGRRRAAGGELSASRPHLPFHGDVPLPGGATERGSADPAQPQRSPSRAAAAPAPGPPAPRGASPGGTTPPPPRRSSAAPRRRGDGPRSAAAPRPSGPRAAAPAPLPAVPAAPPRPAPAAGSDAPSAGRAPRPPRTEPGAAEGRCHAERPPRGGGAAWREGRGRWRRRLRRRRAGVPHSSAV